MSYFLSSQHVKIAQEPASLGARAGALAIDLIIFSISEIAINWFVSSGIFNYRYFDVLAILLFLAPLTYPLICEIAMNGQTLGKRVCNIKVVTLDGGGPKITSLVLRWMILPFDLGLAFGLGELCVFSTKRQQRLGDIVAGTWVVRTNEYEKESFSLSDYETNPQCQGLYPKAKNLSPSQAALIAETLELSLEGNLEYELSRLADNVEQIVGKRETKDDYMYLSYVLNNYRQE